MVDEQIIMCPADCIQYFFQFGICPGIKTFPDFICIPGDGPGRPGWPPVAYSIY